MSPPNTTHLAFLPPVDEQQCTVVLPGGRRGPVVEHELEAEHRVYAHGHVERERRHEEPDAGDVVWQPHGEHARGPLGGVEARQVPALALAASPARRRSASGRGTKGPWTYEAIDIDRAGAVNEAPALAGIIVRAVRKQSAAT